jgi:hypothetical protein
MDAYLTKPMDPKRLFDVVERQLLNSSAGDQLRTTGASRPLDVDQPVRDDRVETDPRALIVARTFER